jgi:GT2 family glycosyltransferase
MIADFVDIVIPVYRNHALTQRCLESVLHNPDPSIGAIHLINDATPEPVLRHYCRQVAKEERVKLTEHAENQGFVVSVNEGLKLTGDRDVVILNSDAEVPKNWLSRLKAAADQNPKTASIVPFSNNATICSYPNFLEDNDLPDGLTLEELDALFAEANAGQVTEISTGVGFCMYLRRAAIDDVGLFDAGAFGRGYGEENDWCLRAAEKGWVHLLAADVFVYHAGRASFGSEASDYQANALAVISERYPDYERQIAAFIEADPLEPARYAVDTARPDAAAVISEYRQREQASRALRYELDRQRHAQVEALDDLLRETREAAESERQIYDNLLSETRQAAESERQRYDYLLSETRQAAKSERQRYEVLLTSERTLVADKEAQYQAQLEEMAAGYQSMEASCASLEKQLLELNRFWPVRIQRWLKRRFGAR